MTNTAVFTVSGSGLSFGGLLRSEWIKLRSLRSTVWCFGIIAIITIGFGLLLASNISMGDAAATTADSQALWVRVVTTSISINQLVVAVLGALIITGEYGTGMIRATLTAAPRRLDALVAKALVLATSAFAISLASIILTALVTVPLLPARGIHPDFGDGKVWLAFLGGALYLALVGVISLAIGTLVRSSAGGISASLGLVFVLPIVMSIVAQITQADWARNVGTLLPSAAGDHMFSYPLASIEPAHPGLIVLDGWQGMLVVIGWAVALFFAAGALLKRRDV